MSLPKKLLFVVLVLVSVAAISGGAVHAATPPPSSQIDISTLPKPKADKAHIQIILTIVFTIIGALSLLFVTVGGFRYIASEGDPQAVSKAKGTIIYALIGLLVSILAVSIVTFILGRVA